MRCKFRFAGLTLALLLVAGTAVQAQDDPTVNIGTVTTDIVSHITYDDPLGGSGSPPTTTEAVAVGPFTGSSTIPATPLLDGALFCVDLWHNQNQGVTYQGTEYGVSSVTTAAVAEGVSSNSNIENLVSYLGYVYNAVVQAGNDAAAAAAIQITLWQLVDAGPHGVTFTNAGLVADVNTIQSLMSGTTETLGGTTILGYGNPGVTQYNVVVFVPNSGQPGQVLVGWVATPEPSSMAIAAVGGLGLVGYGLKKRKRA